MALAATPSPAPAAALRPGDRLGDRGIAADHLNHVAGRGLGAQRLREHRSDVLAWDLAVADARPR